jgi:cell division protein FtsL
MEQVHRLTKQAYSQLPWRSQTQLIVVFMLVVVAAALIAFIYLNTTAQAATIGRQIQELQVRLDDAQDIEYEAPTQDELSPEALASNDLPEVVVPIEVLRMQIATLETQLAALTSLDRVREEAVKAGMAPRDPEKMMYLAVPGYNGRNLANLAPPPRLERVTAPVLPDVYKQSLIDWLKLQIVSTSRMLMDEVKP